MEVTLTGRYDTVKNGGATATVAFNVGNIKVGASITDATIVNCPSLTGLALTIKKPVAFIVDYNVSEKDLHFKFMNTVSVAGKSLNLTYKHSRGDSKTVLDGTLVIDPANKVSANHTLGSSNTKFKYTCVHKGVTTFEPCYDLAKDSWDLAVSRKVYGDDSLKASYETSTKILGLEWSRNSKQIGSVKVSASHNLSEGLKVPKVSAGTTLKFEM